MHKTSGFLWPQPERSWAYNFWMCWVFVICLLICLSIFFFINIVSFNMLKVINLKFHNLITSVKWYMSCQNPDFPVIRIGLDDCTKGKLIKEHFENTQDKQNDFTLILSQEGFLCPMCKKSLPSPEELQAHFDSAHDDKPVSSENRWVKIPWQIFVGAGVFSCVTWHSYILY